MTTMSSIELFLVGTGISVYDAMKKLNQTRRKILFVVDEERRFYGSLTDGDIRRWILADGDLTTGINNVCNRNAFCVHGGYDVESIRHEMFARGIDCIPVLNDAGRIDELLFWDEVFGNRAESKAKRPIDVPVVIMAGGKGARLEPLTRVLPKPLIPIGDKTVIEIIIDRFLAYSVRKFYISINHKSRIIKSYFEELAPSYVIEYLTESKALGTAGALKMLEGCFNGSFILTNCDIVLDADYAALLEFHRTHGYAITLVASMIHYSIPYGICEIGNGGAFVQIREKPEYRFLVNTGMYVLESSALRHIPANTMFHMTDLVDEARKAGGTIGVYPIGEKSWFDTGEWKVYKRAVEEFKL